MKLLVITTFIIFLYFNSFAQQQMNHNSVVEINKNEVKFKENKILLKIYDKYANIDLSSDASNNNVVNIQAIAELNQMYKVTSVKKVFSFIQKINKQPHDLTTIYEIEYQYNISPSELCILYKDVPEVEFAEPDYISSILVNPNDPYYKNGSQTYHSKVKANDAWELTTGDATQIIGIIDTGVDWAHDDLEDNIWANTGEIPGNGIDDDHNGFVDDVRGWDFVNNDNNPMDDNSHGTHVAGIAAAKTNNNLGIAGIAWNAKIMPIKVMQSSGRGTSTDIAKGVAYAAGNGATIQNMSIGAYSESLTLKTALENAYHYSVLVAAAGNDGLCLLECPFKPSGAMYPACYPWVLGVQSSKSNGLIAEWSNYDPSGPTAVGNTYGYNYEVLAPGQSIYSTSPGNGYRYLSGTSMATPIVSGAVALIKSYIPNISTEQIFARIIQSSGSGVIDIYKAMTISLVPNLKLNKFSIIDTLSGGDRDGVADAGESVYINIEAINYGGLASNVKAKLRFGTFEDHTVITINDSASSFGNVSAYARVNNNADPFRITIPSNISNNRDIVLNVEFSSDTDNQKFAYNLVVNAQNGLELKGNNPGLTHLKANRFYLLTENAVFDSLIVDPGVEINSNLNKTMSIGNYMKCDGKVDSMIVMKGVGGNKWNFIKTMTQYDTISFFNVLFKNIYLEYFNSKYVFENCNFKENYMMNFGYSTANNSLLSENLGNSYNLGTMMNSIVSNNSNMYSSEYLLGWYGYTSEQTFQNNSIYNNYKSNFSSRINTLIGVSSATGSKYQFELFPNYFGSTLQKDRDFEIYDYFEYSSIKITNCSNYLSEPHPNVHGHVWKVLLNDNNPYYDVIAPINTETVKFDVFFSRSMDTTITPFLTFGVQKPYTQKAVVDSSRWLNWVRNSLIGNTNYHIQISTDSTFGTVFYEKNDIAGLDYKVNLAPNKRYYWRVRYRNGSNDWQKWSDISNFYTKPTIIPDKPIITYPENGVDDIWTLLTIQWKNDPYSLSYDIQVDNNNDFSSPIYDASVTDNRFTVNSLTKGTTYYIRLRTKNMYGTSSWSDVINLTVTTLTPRGPQLISPANNSEGISWYPIHEWEKLDWVIDYEYQCSSTILFSSYNSYIYTKNKVQQPFTTYETTYWRVRGRRDSDLGAWSSIFKLKRDGLIDKNVSIISPIDSSQNLIGLYINFKWYSSSSAREYNIEIYDSYDKSNLLKSITISSPDSSYLHPTLLNIGKYYWRIRVYGKNGWESWSELKMFEITKDLDPKPLLSVPTNNMKWYDSTLTFKWNNAPGANTVYNARWQAYHTVDFTTGDGLQKIRVAGAKDNEGFEIPIEWNRFEFNVQATATLSNTFIADGQVGKIKLEWGMPEEERDILGFNLYRFKKKTALTWGDTVKVNSILIVDSTYTDFNVIPDSTYYYVYRIVRTTLDEGIDSKKVSAAAYPSVLAPPTLIYPLNNAIKIPISITLDWNEPSGATKYIIAIATDINFTNIIVNEEVTPSQYVINSLSNRTRYYWKVKAEGLQGVSLWSETRTFLTIPVIPSVPQLVFPENNSISQPLALTYDWANASEADSYQLQIAIDLYFINIINDVTGISSSNKYLSGLAINKTYFWRVRSKNDAGYSEWSNKWQFTTDTAGAALPPISWNYIANTGNNASIVIPKNINPQINGRNILAGDAIGVFYLNQGVYKCAGNVIWEGQNAALNVWGDDLETNEKDGFSVNEKYILKLWDSRAGKELFSQFTFASGPDYYEINGYSVLGYLNSIETITQTIILNKGWNMISSYLSINMPDSVQYVCIPINEKLTILKNGAGLTYIPSYSINYIGSWNTLNGYQAYLSAIDTLFILGLPVQPELSSINLNTGWSLISYLRNTAMDAELSLASITDNNRLVIAKNGAGKTYIPAFGINQIGNMNPGEGYQVYMSAKDTLVYPANSLGKVSVRLVDDIDVNYIKNDYKNTGNNSTLILNLTADDNTEVAIYNSKKEIVGSGLVRNGISAITLWGDNTATDDIDGATDNENLTAKLYNPSTNSYREIKIDKVESLTNNKDYTSLNYKTNAVYQAKANVEPEAKLLMAVPNPFNKGTEITYTIKESGNVELTIYAISGELIATLVNGFKAQGTYKLNYENSLLPSGEYNLIMTSGSDKEMIKLVNVK